jgi:hypothetical protein
MTKPILSLLELAVAIGVPALIAFFAPRRWRLRAVGLWALTPLLVLLAMGASEIVSGKTTPANLQNLIYGLLLIGAFTLLPWLMTVGVGFALGAILRGRGAPKAVAAAPGRSEPIPQAQPTPAPITYSPQLDTRGRPLSPPGGWQAAHVGPRNDGLVLDGLRVWSLPWRVETDEPVMLDHPAHPTQQHAFTMYNIEDGGRAARFAAAEVSSGVWGFYRGVVPADAASGASADGTLRDPAEALENAARKSAAAQPPRRMIAAPRPTARNWLVALLIFVGTIALIAAATWITLQLKGEPAPQRLDTIPPMPGSAVTPVYRPAPRVVRP